MSKMHNDWLMAASGASEVLGQTVLTDVGTTSWTVPAGVSSISAVAVQAGGSASGASISRGATVLLRAMNGSRVGDGGGDGGSTEYGSKVNGSTGDYYQVGGPGAGGYSGAGGNGGSHTDVSFFYRAPTAGAGGGGGGGEPHVQFSGGGTSSTSVGGGVGLLGQGSSGGTGASGQPGSGGSGATYGGCYWDSTPVRGGALSWRNSIPVTPGEVLTISIGARSSANSGPGAIRILWGGGRSFPSNAGDM